MDENKKPVERPGKPTPARQANVISYSMEAMVTYKCPIQACWLYGYTGDTEDMIGPRYRGAIQDGNELAFYNAKKIANLLGADVELEVEWQDYGGEDLPEKVDETLGFDSHSRSVKIIVHPKPSPGLGKWREQAHQLIMDGLEEEWKQADRDAERGTHGKQNE